MTDLAAFLLARIAEDEAIASEVVRKWRTDGGRWMLLDDGPTWHCGEQSDHLAVAPARVLAECASKRAIVEEHPHGTHFYSDGSGGVGCYTCDNGPSAGSEWVPRGAYCPTLRALAQPYAGHPGWDEGWTL